MCAPNEDEALAKGIEGTNFFGYSLAHYYVFGNHQPGVTDVWAEYEQRRDAAGYSPDAVIAAADNSDRLGAKLIEEGISGLRGAVGTPDQIRDFLRRYEACGVDQIIFVSQAGKNKHEDIMESIELFGREVLPEFKERQEKADHDKAQRLAPVFEDVMARKPAADHPALPSPDYAFPAIPRAIADRSGSDDFHAWLDDLASKRAAGDRSPIIPGGLG